MQNVRTLSIIIPSYNEELTITKVLDRIREVELIQAIKKEIIVVNDCSTDGTDPRIKEYIHSNPDVNIRYFTQAVNMGKGAAIHLGILHARGDYLIIQDADLEYDPTDYNTLLKPMLRANADVVYGSRFMGGNPHRILFFWHTIGNRVLTFLSNISTNLNLTDMETGYKLFRTSLLRQVRLQERRFGFEPEVTAKLAKVPGIKIYEVGISYYGRTFQEGKKINWVDGFRALYCIVKYKFSKHFYEQSLATTETGPLGWVVRHSTPHAQNIGTL